MFSFLRLSERIIVVAVAVDVVGIELVNVLHEVDEEESAACWVGVELARVGPIHVVVRIGKGTSFEVLHFTSLDMCEIHYPISYKDALKFDLKGRLRVGIILVNQYSEVRDILSCIWLASYPEIAIAVFFELVKEAH